MPKVTLGNKNESSGGTPDASHGKVIDHGASTFQPPTISLPKGGGAIRGIGEKFGSNLVTGGGSMSVPIATSPGRSGFGPQLSISYDSAAGNGMFGFGWSISLPSITRKTNKGLPQYLDAADSDVFVLSGAEDLVPVLNPDGTRQRDETTDADFTVHRFRPRIEGMFARIERWTRHSDGEIHWRTISKDNILSMYGKDADSRITDPMDTRHVFSWLICQVQDDKGNAIIYDYKREDGIGVDLASACESNRGDRSDIRRTANRYLKRIRYGNRISLLNAAGHRPRFLTHPMILNAGWMFEVIFDYGEHDANVPTPADSGPWAFRADPFSSYRPGFEVRTTRLCQRVLMFHHFPGEAGVGDNCLVRSTDFTYSNEQNPGSDRNPVYTFLRAVTQTGYQRDGAGYRTRSLPQVEFEYSEPVVQDTVEVVGSASLENLPTGIDGAVYQWTDLHGEGIPGILTEQADAWFYKRNISPISERQVAFAPIERVALKPSLSLPVGAQFMDLAGDGEPDMVVFDGPSPGLYEHDENEGWRPFRPFTSRLNRNTRDPNLKFVDLDGDGRADVLITDDDALVWHPSLAEAGFGPALRVANSLNEETGPRLVFSDGTQSIYLADLSGDGLTDLVRIRNGEVCYWPNLGYGRFGAKVTMDNSPQFDNPDQFDQQRVRLADIDGSGTTDIIYLHRDGVRLYFNRSGNSWSLPKQLNIFPRVDDLVSIVPTDLLGNGTTCLVWSSPLPSDARRPMRYVNLMGGQKPHLLVRTINNLGAETRVHYATSTKFYLQDKRDGKPWITRLPFPVHVVEKVTVMDKWRQTTFSSTYSYHHGYFDGIEREFRGFGRVEQTDVEHFGAFAAGNVTSPYLDDDQTLYQPPVKTITWFHTGAFLDRERILSRYQTEYFAPRSDDFSEAALPEPELASLDLSTEEWREALRACKGMMLRQEVYELDVDALARGEERRVKLFSTTFHNCHIQRLQPLGNNHHGVFLVTESEAIAYHYELDLQAVPLVPDPRVAHTLNLRIDEIGNVLEEVAIAYPRISPHQDASLPTGVETMITQVQQEQHLVYTENRFTHDAIEDDEYRLRLPCAVKTYELTGIVPGSGMVFTLAELRQAAIAETVSEIAYHALPDRAIPQKRLVEQVRMLYFSDDLATPLPFGQINSLALPYETYKLALTNELLETVLSERLTHEIRHDLDNADVSGYLSGPVLVDRFPDLNTTGQYWIRSGIPGFGENARDRFYLPDRSMDAFGNATTLTFDAPYNLFPRSTTDPVGNKTEVLRFNYRVLAPEEIRDPNQNLSEVAFDVSGMPVVMAVKGKGAEGDSMRDVPLEIEGDRLIRFFTGAYDEAEARALLGSATTRHLYYFGEQATADGGLSYGSHPACAARLVREVHVAQGGEANPLQVGFEYSDGMGSVLVQKEQAEPENEGEPLRWIANGKTILNNKGNPVKQYEPYFSPGGHRFEEPMEVGVTAVMYYDAAGRQVRTELPDGTFSRVEFSPWFVATWDGSDTILDNGNDWYARRTDPVHPKFAQFGTPENRLAARLAAIHANTPAVTHLDSLGREVVAIAHNRFERGGAVIDEKHVTKTKLDAEGKPLWIQDARGNRVMEYIKPVGAETNYAPCYDIAGNLLFQHSMDGGDRWMLMDATGQPFYAWDVNERAVEGGGLVLERRIFHTIYDALRRPVALQLQINDADDPLVVERFIYRDPAPDAPNPADRDPEAAALNLGGQVYQHYDPSGVMTNQRFDFKGNLLEASRQLTQTYNAPVIDWNTEIPSEEVFTQTTQYDALNRMTRQDNWHRSGQQPATYTPRYNQRGVLVSETLTVQGQSTEAIQEIEYDAKGQRLRIDYGNNTSTTYNYDSQTFRLTRLTTTRTEGGRVYQDLHYSYDPVGNITHIRDDAQQTIYFRNHRVDPSASYTYDALYRLNEATGREHLGLTAQGQPQPPTPPDQFNRFHADQPHIHDGNAMGSYVERYTYDAVGNILEMAHHGSDPRHPGWTRHYEYAADSNRLLRTWLGSHEMDAVRYDYDTHGSMLNLANTSNDYRLRWDYRDMIHTANLGGGGQAFYNYDSNKQRNRKRIERNGSRVEERLYLGGMELYRRWENGVLVEEIETHHLFVNDQRALIVEDVLRTNNPRLAPGVLFRYQYGNHLGSVALELNQDAEIISYEEYHPYGTTAYQANNAVIRSSAKRYKYTGMERDEETGLSYHAARYYLPWLGRWASADPIDIRGGQNLYVYAGSDPCRWSDANGMIVPVLLLFAAIAIAGGILLNPAPAGAPEREYTSEEARDLELRSRHSWIRTPGTVAMIAAIPVAAPAVVSASPGAVFYGTGAIAAGTGVIGEAADAVDPSGTTRVVAETTIDIGLSVAPSGAGRGGRGGGGARRSGGGGGSSGGGRRFARRTTTGEPAVEASRPATAHETLPVPAAPVVPDAPTSSARSSPITPAAAAEVTLAETTGAASSGVTSSEAFASRIRAISDASGPPGRGNIAGAQGTMPGGNSVSMIGRNPAGRSIGLPLPPKSRAILGPSEVPVRAGGAHPDVFTVKALLRAGVVPESVATVTRFCPICAATLEGAGIRMIGGRQGMFAGVTDAAGAVGRLNAIRAAYAEGLSLAKEIASLRSSRGH
jgi:RHS repeat-associated protein